MKRHGNSDSSGSSSSSSGGSAAVATKRGKRVGSKSTTVVDERVELSLLPKAKMYEKSFMHRDTVTHICVVPSEPPYVVTASRDGHVKFWRKQPVGVEFVKHIRAHMGPVAGLAASPDGLTLVSVGVDKGMKIYDVLSWDMINMYTLDFVPSALSWISHAGRILAVADSASPAIHIFDIGLGVKINEKTKTAIPTCSVTSVHRAPVTHIEYNDTYQVVVSTDKSGMIEYWDNVTPHGHPKGKVKFDMKISTDLFALLKAKTRALSLKIAPSGERFAIVGADLVVRVFDFATGRLLRAYDESTKLWTSRQESQQEDDDGDEEENSPYKLESLDYGRRRAVEQEIAGALGLSGDASSDKTCVPPTAVFDESGRFLMFPTPVGIKVYSIARNKVVRLLGKVENSTRFLGLALYQGSSEAESSSSSSSNNTESAGGPDPTLFCTAYKQHRFYMFTLREPEDPDENNLLETGRDVFNEKPNEEAQLPQTVVRSSRLARSAVIHTTFGDIFIKLFPDECPRTVENFTVHSKDGYYNGVLFHRIVKGFIIQTGDPKGDGTGGESIWGGYFEDEFSRSLKHDRPFTVAMANAGPNTNGSQFYITTVPCPSLDGKHTVFGRVYRGMEVVSAIEDVRTNRKTETPLKEIKIINIDTSTESPDD